LFLHLFAFTVRHPFYTLNSIKLTTSDYSIINNVLSARIKVSLNKTLKVKSVNDLPHVKGMKNKLNKLKSTNDADAADAENIVNAKINDLSEYIGTSSDQNDTFQITANIINGDLDLNNAKLEFLNDVVLIPASYFIPDTEATMTQNGEKDLIEELAAKKKHQTSASPMMALAAFTYNRITARDYADRWTSEVSSSPYYNTAWWNTNYVWHTESGGVDCANYVSQALSAGGIPQDTTWKPETTAWVNTGRNITNGLKQYMVDTKGYFYKATKSTTSAGGFISAVSYSHVMFVTANDTVTMLFSAHTNDRYRASFASFGTDYEFYYINSAYL
jgi:hypothetical protein